MGKTVFPTAEELDSFINLTPSRAFVRSSSQWPPICGSLCLEAAFLPYATYEVGNSRLCRVPAFLPLRLPLLRSLALPAPFPGVSAESLVELSLPYLPTESDLDMLLPDTASSVTRLVLRKYSDPVSYWTRFTGLLELGDGLHYSAIRLTRLEALEIAPFRLLFVHHLPWLTRFRFRSHVSHNYQARLGLRELKSLSRLSTRFI